MDSNITFPSFISFVKSDFPSNKIFHSSCGGFTLSFKEIRLDDFQPEGKYIEIEHVDHNYGDDRVYISIYLNEHEEFLRGKSTQKYWGEEWQMDEVMIIEWITPCLKEEIISYITSLHEIKEPAS